MCHPRGDRTRTTSSERESATERTPLLARVRGSLPFGSFEDGDGNEESPRPASDREPNAGRERSTPTTLEDDGTTEEAREEDPISAD